MAIIRAELISVKRLPGREFARIQQSSPRAKIALERPGPVGSGDTHLLCFR